jgi:hypothetical protein
MEVIKNKGRLLYSDTDSVFASFNHDVINEKHGEIVWKDKIEKAIFAIPKGYSIIRNNKEETKLKGFKKNSISFDKFNQCFRENIEIRQTQEHFLKSGLIPFLATIEKNTKLSTYDKRIFNKDKTETYPIKIGPI